jgi:hypothetical protein
MGLNSSFLFVQIMKRLVLASSCMLTYLLVLIYSRCSASIKDWVRFNRLYRLD